MLYACQQRCVFLAVTAKRRGCLDETFDYHSAYQISLRPRNNRTDRPCTQKRPVARVETFKVLDTPSIK